MPQFPHDLPSEQRDGLVDPIRAADKNVKRSAESTTSSATRLKSKESSAPIKFKQTVSPPAPVQRVRRPRGEKSRGTSGNPFKDPGLFDDPESIFQLRDLIGRPLVLTVVALSIVGLIFWLSRPSTSEGGRSETLRNLLATAEKWPPAVVDSGDNEELMSALQDKVTLADELLAFDSDAEAKTRGAELKLQALTQWDTLLIEKNAISPEVLEKLDACSKAFINSRDEAVSNLSFVGRTLIRIHKYFEQPEKRYFAEILDQFKLVSGFASEDLGTAQNLVRVVRAFDDRELTDEATQLWGVMIAFSSSPNSEIAAIGNSARQRLFSSNSLYNDLVAMLPTDKQSSKFPLESIRQRLGEFITQESVSATNLESALNFVDFLVSQSAEEYATIILDDLENAIYYLDAGVQRDAIKRRYDSTKKRVDLIGERFSFDGLFSVQGRPISRANLSRRDKLIVFWSPENSSSIDVLNQISENQTDFASRQIQVVAIATISGNASDKESISKISNSTKGIEFLTVIKGESLSQAFLTQYPIPRVPYWVLLNKDDQIVGWNSKLNFISIDVK